MPIHVYHGTNSLLLRRMQAAGAIMPLSDPLITDIKRSAAQADDGYRSKMVRRASDIWIATGKSTSGRYAVSSPELLITSMNILTVKNPELAREYLRQLEEQGWLEARPVVLTIRIDSPLELGLPSSFQLDPRAVAAAAGPTDELILHHLPIDRIISMDEIPEPHLLGHVRTKLLDVTTLVSSKDIVERITPLAMKIMEVAPQHGVSREEADSLIEFLQATNSLPGIYTYLINENKTRECGFRDSDMLREIYGTYLRPIEQALAKFLGSALRQKMKDSPEYIAFRIALADIMSGIAEIYAQDYYLSTNRRYMNGINGNAFFIVEPVGRIRHNKSVLSIDDEGAESCIAKIMAEKSVITREKATEALERLLKHPFEVNKAWDPSW